MADNVMLTSGHVMNMEPPLVPLVAQGAGHWVPKGSPDAAIQVTLTTSTGNGSATVNIEVSNDGVNPCATVAGTITFASATCPQADGLATQNASWKYVRLNVTALAGTGAAVNGTIGI